MRMIPKILFDSSKLQEIYDLRVDAYEHSPKSIYINRKIFPNGWKDHLDENPRTMHWIIEDKDRIIAAARIAILNNYSDSGENLMHCKLSNSQPIAYLSRLVIHHEYRGRGLSTTLDKVRMNFIHDNDIPLGLACSLSDRKKVFLKLGWKQAGKVAYTYGGNSPPSIQFVFTYQNKKLMSYDT